MLAVAVMLCGCGGTQQISDADHDGVADRHDACPAQSEDRDSFQDDDGCPDEDNDGDGLRDVDDACPLEAEDLDDFEDTDGCPEDATAVPSLRCTELQLHVAIRFAEESDAIDGPNEAVLNELAAVLTSGMYDFELLVAGHTNPSTEGDNDALSQRRADSVLAYLLAQGVPSTALAAQGFGGERPVVDPASDPAPNRRVDFQVLSPRCVEGD